MLTLTTSVRFTERESFCYGTGSMANSVQFFENQFRAVRLERADSRGALHALLSQSHGDRYNKN